MNTLSPTRASSTKYRTRRFVVLGDEDGKPDLDVENVLLRVTPSDIRCLPPRWRVQFGAIRRCFGWLFSPALHGPRARAWMALEATLRTMKRHDGAAFDDLMRRALRRVEHGELFPLVGMRPILETSEAA